MAKKTRVFMTACGAPGSTGILRSLADKPDIDLVLADTHPLNSGFCFLPNAPRYVIPDGDHPDFADIVFKIASKHQVDLVFPIADEEVMALAPELERFARANMKVICSPPGTLEVGTDKEKITRIAAKLGIPCPELYTKEQAVLVLKKGDSVVVKPKRARGGQGVSIVKNLDELEQGLSCGSAHGKSMMIQENIPGESGSIHVVGVLLDPRSAVKATFVCHSLKTKFSHGGPAIAGEPVRVPQLVDMSLRLLEHTGPWRGPVNVEFKLDARDGLYKLFEINPRIWGYSYLATAAGINFPYLAVRTFRGEEFEPIRDYRSDLALVRCTDDKIISATEMKVDEI